MNTLASLPKVDGNNGFEPLKPSKGANRLRLMRKFSKFCLVGGSGVLVDMGLLFLLADPRLLGLNITVSKIFAAEVAMINNFIWNEFWTFRQDRLPEVDASSFRKGIPRRFLTFNAICGIGIGLAVLFLNLFHLGLGWNLYLSNLAAVLLVTVWNYSMNAQFNWKKRGATTLED